jgi:hypothetical protein
MGPSVSELTGGPVVSGVVIITCRRHARATAVISATAVSGTTAVTGATAVIPAQAGIQPLLLAADSPESEPCSIQA